VHIVIKCNVTCTPTTEPGRVVCVEEGNDETVTLALSSIFHLPTFETET
jgi:hypothetical protein